MQTLVIGVGEFGINTSCHFFTHLILEHDLLNLTNIKQDLIDYSLFFTEMNDSNDLPYKANILLFDTTYDSYFNILKNYPLLSGYISQQQVIQLHQLPGSSHYTLIESLRKNQLAKDIIRDVLRKEFEKHKYSSVLVFHSIAGGTGAGLGSCILVEVANLRSRVCVTVNVMLIPSEYQGMSTNCLEWYNAASALETVNEQCELTILLDNQALSRIYRSSTYGLGIDDLNIKVQDLNILIIQLVAQITSSQRYQSKISKKFQDIIVNTVLYRSIHFVVPSIYNSQSLILNLPNIWKEQQQKLDNMSMLQSEEKSQKTMTLKYSSNAMKKYSKFRFLQNPVFKIVELNVNQHYTSPTSIMIDLFERQNCLATCDELNASTAKQFYNTKDKYAAVYCHFNMAQTESAISQSFYFAKDYLTKTTQSDFMSMSPCPFTYSLTDQKGFVFRKDQNLIEISSCMLQNKFTIHNIFDRIHQKTTNLFAKKCFLNWIDCQEMQKAIDSVKCLERDYGDWVQAEEIVHLFEDSLREDEVSQQSDSLSDSF